MRYLAFVAIALLAACVGITDQQKKDIIDQAKEDIREQAASMMTVDELYGYTQNRKDGPAPLRVIPYFAYPHDSKDTVAVRGFWFINQDGANDRSSMVHSDTLLAWLRDSISGGGGSQTLAYSNDSLTIDNGNTVVITGFADSTVTVDTLVEHLTRFIAVESSISNNIGRIDVNELLIQRNTDTSGIHRIEISNLNNYRQYAVDSTDQIYATTFPENAIVTDRARGGRYLIQPDSQPGYITDSLAVIPTGSNYAILQPTANGYNVKHFNVKGDHTDQTEKLTKVWAFAETKSVYFPSDTGSYVIDRARPRSNTIINFEPGSIIEGLASGSSTGLFYLQDVENVTFKGNGCRMYQSRSGNQSMWYILGGSHITIDNFICTGTGKDGIYVGEGASGDSVTNLTIRDVVLDSMKRQGISVVHADGVRIEGGKIMNTAGQSPAAGIDLEGNKGNTVRNVVVDGVYFYNNDEQGGVFAAYATNCIVSNCVFEQNLYAANIDLAGAGEREVLVESIDVGTDIITTDTIHDLEVGSYVRIQAGSGGGGPGGISSSTTYRVLEVPTDSSFIIGTAYGYGQVNITTAGTLPIRVRIWIMDMLSDIQFINNICRNNGTNFFAEQARNLTFIGNHIDSGSLGINLVNVENALVTGNHIKNVSGRGIYITDRYARITNNHVENITLGGIYCTGMHSGIVSNNILKNTGDGEFPLFLKHANDNIVSNNTIVNDTPSVGTYGIVLDALTMHNQVFGNVIHNDYSNTTRSTVNSGTDNYVYNNILNDSVLDRGVASVWLEEGDGDIYYAGGNVGIGLTNPIFKLEIADNAPVIRINDLSGPYYHYLNSSNTELRVQAHTNLSIRGTTADIYTGGAKRLAVNANNEILLGGDTDSGSFPVQMNGETHIAGGLEITTTTSAFIPPRLTTTQRDNLTGSSGMMIYNTTVDSMQFYNGTSWFNLNMESSS